MRKLFQKQTWKTKKILTIFIAVVLHIFTIDADHLKHTYPISSISYKLFGIFQLFDRKMFDLLRLMRQKPHDLKIMVCVGVQWMTKGNKLNLNVI